MNQRPRIIPCLLLRDRGLVKTVRFKAPTYLGDPVNVVRIFNDKEVDELVLLDTTASLERRGPRFDFLRAICSECFMPLCYGGGVRSLEDMRRLFGGGFEKIALNSHAVEAPDFVGEAANRFGSQSIVVSIDARRKLLGGYEVVTHSGTRRTGIDPVELARRVASAGAGEILLNSIDRDGTMDGYDLALVGRVSAAVGIPVIACGGAGSLTDMVTVVRKGGASAAAAGSLFVFRRPHRAVLISYPPPSELEHEFGCAQA